MRIGIDIGSTTVKVVVLDDNDNTIFKTYERHMSKVREKTAEMLHRLTDTLGGQEVQVAITGSAGLGVANASGIDFVQEVFATAGAVERFIPDTDVVVELGGEDAKIIFLTGGLEERMNGSCAGGTGAFIDQMATLLNISADELDALSLQHEKLYAIASRCGVFAKSDIQPLLNQGAQKADVAASIFQAVVNQTVAGLAQGREIKGKVLFLGGPLFFLKGLRQRFVETLKLTPENAVFPDNADVFVAVGAACYAGNGKPMKFEELLERIEKASAQKNTTNTMPPLFASDEEYEAFAARHAAHCPPPMDADSYRGDAYLGVDAGSTTTKVALVSPACCTPTTPATRATPSPWCWGSSRKFTAASAIGSPSGAARPPATARISSKTLSISTAAWWKRWRITAQPAISARMCISSSTSAART